MKIRPDIADLIRAGHTDTRIAYEVGCHRTTVNRTRRAMHVPPVRVLDRLAVEAVPVLVRDRYREPLSVEQQAANRELLAAAVYRQPRRAARDLPSYPDHHPAARPDRKAC